MDALSFVSVLARSGGILIQVHMPRGQHRLGDILAEADCGIAFLAFGTRKPECNPDHNGLRGAKAGYDAFLKKDAHKSEIQLREATFEKLQYAELKM
jgi:hypothetical protein